MDDTLASKLRQLVTNRSTAALGTLHSGAPYFSMVPFVLLSDASAFIIHVSLLAAHTKDMLADPRVSLLIAESERAGFSPQALPRVTVLGTARQLSRGSPEEFVARDPYLARFPDAPPTFHLGDFSLFAITPTTLRWVAGFAQARSLTPRSFAEGRRPDHKAAAPANGVRGLRTQAGQGRLGRRAALRWRWRPATLGWDIVEA